MLWDLSFNLINQNRNQSSIKDLHIMFQTIADDPVQYKVSVQSLRHDKQIKSTITVSINSKIRIAISTGGTVSLVKVLRAI